MTNVLLLTSTPLIGNAISDLLKNKFQDSVLDTLVSGKGVIERLHSKEYQLFILDSSLALTLLPVLPKKPALLLSDNSSKDVHFYQAGVYGVFDKKHGLDELELAIKETLHGNIYLNNELRKQLLHKNNAVPGMKLSKREAQVFQMLMDGTKTSEISKKLMLKPSTVSTFKFKLYRKFGVSNLVQLHMAAEKHNFSG